MIGRTFGRLTVIHEVTPKGGHKRYYCRCVCNMYTVVKGNSLRTKNTLSCGCLRREKSLKRLPIRTKLPDNLSAKHEIFGDYRNRAKKRGFDFLLNFEDFLRIIEDKCHYCESSHSNCKNGYNYNGIDRVDANVGYIFSNVVSCCRTCNIAKSDMPLSEFLGWVERVYTHSAKKGSYVSKD
jgi:hypothetical protein